MAIIDPVGTHCAAYYNTIIALQPMHLETNSVIFGVTVKVTFRHFVSAGRWR